MGKVANTGWNGPLVPSNTEFNGGYDPGIPESTLEQEHTQSEYALSRMGEIDEERRFFTKAGLVIPVVSILGGGHENAQATAPVETNPTGSSEKPINRKPSRFEKEYESLKDGVHQTTVISKQARALRREGIGGLEDAINGDKPEDQKMPIIYIREMVNTIMEKVMVDHMNGNENAEMPNWGDKERAWALLIFSLTTAFEIERLMKKFFPQDYIEMLQIVSSDKDSYQAAERNQTSSGKILHSFLSKDVGPGVQKNGKNLEFTDDGKIDLMNKMLADDTISDERIAFTAWAVGLVSANELGIGFRLAIQNVSGDARSKDLFSSKKPSEVESNEWEPLINIHPENEGAYSLDGVIHSLSNPCWHNTDDNWRTTVIKKIREARSTIQY